MTARLGHPLAVASSEGHDSMPRGLAQFPSRKAPDEALKRQRGHDKYTAVAEPSLCPVYVPGAIPFSGAHVTWMDNAFRRWNVASLAESSRNTENILEHTTSLIR
jgi:hypothetical protein